MSVKFSIIQLNSPSKSVPNIDTRQLQSFSLVPHSATTHRELQPFTPSKKHASSYYMPKPPKKKKAVTKERSYILPVLVDVERRRRETFRSFVLEEDVKNEEREKKLKVMDMKLKKNSEIDDVQFHQHSRLKVLDSLKKKSKGTMYMSELWNTALYCEVVKTSGLGTVLDKIKKSRYQPKDAVVRKMEKMYKHKHPDMMDDNYSIEIPSLTSRDLQSKSKIDTIPSISEENEKTFSYDPKSAKSPVSITELNSELTTKKKINLPQIAGIPVNYGSLSARNYIPSLNEDKTLTSDRTFEIHDYNRFGYNTNSPSIFKTSRQVGGETINDISDNLGKNKYDRKLKSILKRCEIIVEDQANILKDVSKLKQVLNQPSPRQKALIQRRKDEISDEIRAALRHSRHKGH